MQMAAVLVTGQLKDTPTQGLPTRGLVNSQTGQLADVAGSSCSFKYDYVNIKHVIVSY